MLDFLQKYAKKFGAVIVCAIVLTAIGIYEMQTEKAESKNIASELAENDNKNTISVYVGGEVEKEGYYKLKNGARVGDAVEAAGGFTENANQKINVSVVLKDGGKVIVKALGEDANAGIDYKVNINSATVQELVALDGIGEKTAERIIAYREENGKFQSVDQIMNVSGIGENTYEKIKSIIVVE